MKRYFTPLEAPNLIQEEDILPYVYDRIFTVSEGTINDFSLHSPMVALAEGLDLPIRELRYWMNRFADAVAINHLKIVGVQRELGSSAQVTLTFTLSAPLASQFILSAGYLASTSNSIEFITDELLVIPSGQLNGSVSATAVKPGVAGNVGIGQITQLSESRAFLQAVNNLEAASGGRDEETIEQVLSRGFQAIRYRGMLITQDDFEQEAIRQLGVGAVVRCIGGLSADKTFYEKGTAHLFVLNPDGSRPSAAQLEELHNAMQSAVPAFMNQDRAKAIATYFYVSAMEVLPLILSVIVQMNGGDDPLVRANAIYEQLGRYLKPGNLEPGASVVINELEYVVRTTGVQYVQIVSCESVVLNETGQILSRQTEYGNVPLRNNWTIPTLYGAVIDLVDQQGNSFQFGYGNSGDPD
jgi:hypothetical protein